jgi:dolichyl-phosphate-mannose--protein O-mannosyl transferase
MNRLLIFAAIAPPLGFVVAFWVMLQIANWLAGSPITFDVAQIMMLPTIYLVGLIPALMVAWFDHALAKHNVAYRIALTALFGYAISYLPLAMAYRVGFAHAPEVLLFGLIGAVPSAVCSWLAAERQAPDLFRHHDRMRSSGRV